MSSSLAALAHAAQRRRLSRRSLIEACRAAGPAKVTEYLDTVPDNLFIWTTITEAMYPEWGEFPWTGTEKED